MYIISAKDYNGHTKTKKHYRCNFMNCTHRSKGCVQHVHGDRHSTGIVGLGVLANTLLFKMEKASEKTRAKKKARRLDFLFLLQLLQTLEDADPRGFLGATSGWRLIIKYRWQNK